MTSMTIMMTRIATIWANPRLRLPSVCKMEANGRVRKANIPVRVVKILARILVNEVNSGASEFRIFPSQRAPIGHGS